MNDHKEIHQRMRSLVHNLSQPLNIIALSCANIENHIRNTNNEFDSEYISKKTGIALKSISEAGRLIEEMKMLYKDN